MVLSHQAQLCPGSARWWRAQSSKQWSSILVVSAFIWQLNSSSFLCPDHATHQPHCSLGHTISSMITWRRCLQGGYGSCSSYVSHCSVTAGSPSLRMAILTIPACPPTLQVAQPHAGLLLFFSQRGVNTIPVRRTFATNVASPLRYPQSMHTSVYWSSCPGCL